MNYFRVRGVLIAGIQAIPVQVECAQSRRLPFLQVIGASASEAAELRERVIAALDAFRFRLPARRITIQFQPGVHQLPLAQLDLAVAVALLGSAGLIPSARTENLLFSGSLGLDGSLRACGNRAALRRILQEGSYASAVLPGEDSEVLREEQRMAGGGFRDLGEVVRFLRNASERPCQKENDVSDPERQAPPPGQIWNRIEGQEIAKRMLEIAAAGAHHVLLPGPSSLRPELLAHALSALLPPLSKSEFEEVRAIYALAGMDYLYPTRPFFSFGSSLGLPPLLADRRLARVEECLLAHRGVLYVDQICERGATLFPGLLPSMLTGTLQARLGQRRIAVPAECIVVAASPICACGAKGDERLVCSCRPTEARRFAEKWRRLLRFPFDLCLPADREHGEEEEVPWQERAERVLAARALMRARQGKENGRLLEEEAFSAKPWRENALKIWQLFGAREVGEGGRALALARVALTISDLRAGHQVEERDLLEARHYFSEDFGGGRRGRSKSPPILNSSATP